MTLAMTNGRPQRKQLADQLDRLDGIIDLLGEGLSQAVADACRDGARLAVKDAILEILRNPELRTLLSNPVPAPPAPQPKAPSGPSRWERIKAKFRAARRKVQNRFGRMVEAFVGPWKKLRDGLAFLTATGGEPLPFKRIGIVAVSLGAAEALVSLLMPHTVASAAAGAGTACTAAVLQVGGWLNSVYRRFDRAD